MTISLFWTYNGIESKSESRIEVKKDMVTINDRVKDARKKLGLSQYDLANKVKFLNQSQISKIETGNRSISARDLIGISEALHIPIEKLLEGLREEDT